MKMKVVTTITSYLDIDTMETSHEVDVADEDGLSEVSSDVMGAVIIGALRATENAVRAQFPGAGRAARRADAEDSPSTPITDDER